jgi:hypothetical protein
MAIRDGSTGALTRKLCLGRSTVGSDFPIDDSLDCSDFRMGFCTSAASPSPSSTKVGTATAHSLQPRNVMHRVQLGFTLKLYSSLAQCFSAADGVIFNDVEQLEG